MKNIYYSRIFYTLFLLLIVFNSCKKEPLNYITYYQQVNEIDSIYRYTNQPKLVVEKYKKLFDKFPPRNQQLIREYETYIVLSDRYGEDFGGKESLLELIHFLSPSYHHDSFKPYYSLFAKYGLDSLAVDKEYRKWENNLDKVLLDSFSIARERDQQPRLDNDYDLMELNDKKNIQLFKLIMLNLVNLNRNFMLIL